MKIRTSFVTNSSSSSYVIAYRSLPDFDEETLTKYPFLKTYGQLVEKILCTEGNNETTAGKVFCTKEDYDKWFVDNWGWRDQTIDKLLADDSWLLERYNNAIKYIEKGFNILCKSVDYSDDYCEAMFRELAKDNENFVILEDE